MKKLLLLPLLLLLTGCVSYYAPETAIEDGVYYAEDDPAYINNAYSYTYGGFYPWSSMDYFYLGYGPYAGFGYGYGGYSLSFSYGYSPWYYPYYSYYSPRYDPYHPHYNRPYYSHRGRGYCGRHNNCGRRDNRHRGGRDEDRYVGNERTNPRNRGGDETDGNEESTGRRGGRSESGNYSAPPARRYVSTPPAGTSGDQGMVVRSREARKPGKSRILPVDSTSTQAIDLKEASPVAAEPVQSSRRGNTVVRNRSRSKRGRSRADPVEPVGRVYSASSPSGSVSAQSGQNNTVAREPTPVVRSRQGGGEVRYRSGSKQGRSHTNGATSNSAAPAASNSVKPTVATANNRGTGQSSPVKSDTKRSRRSSSSSKSLGSRTRTTSASSSRSRTASPGRSSAGRSSSGSRGSRKDQ